MSLQVEFDTPSCFLERCEDSYAQTETFVVPLVAVEGDERHSFVGCVLSRA